MKRRDVLKSLAAITGHALYPTVVTQFLSGCRNEGRSPAPVFFTEEEMTLLGEIVDTVIPTTDTPGAKEAGVHMFVDLFVNHCFDQEQRRTFRQGLQDLEACAQQQHNSRFTESTVAQRVEALEMMEQGKWEGAAGQQFTSMLKDLTLTGYLNTEIGATQFAEYIHVPGEYRGCIELKPDQRIWAV